MKKPEKFKRQLNFSRHEYNELLQHLDTLDDVPETAVARESDRIDYRVADIPFTMVHPDGHQACFYVFGRNISSQGMGILHGGFIHKGVRCRVILNRESQKPLVVVGEVRHCRYLAGACHEVGIKFLKEIDISQLINRKRTVDPASFSSNAARLSLGGSVLIYQRFESDRRMLEHHFLPCGTTLHSASSTGETMDSLKTRPFNLLVCDIEDPPDESIRMIERIREMGWNRSIFALVYPSDIAVLARLQNLENVVPLVRPLHPHFLLCQLLAHLGHSASAPLVDDRLIDQPGFLALLDGLLSRLPTLLREMQAARNKDDRLRFRQLLSHLIASGSSLGMYRLAATGIRLDTTRDRDSDGADDEQAWLDLQVVAQTMIASHSTKDDIAA